MFCKACRGLRNTHLTLARGIDMPPLVFMMMPALRLGSKWKRGSGMAQTLPTQDHDSKHKNPRFWLKGSRQRGFQKTWLVGALCCYIPCTIYSIPKAIWETPKIRGPNMYPKIVGLLL